MFIDDKKFKRAFKNAFMSTGVQLMSEGERLHVSTPEWAMEVERGDIPNKMLAAIIELCGEVPPCGCAFTAKHGECNQETIVYGVWTASEKYNELTARKVDKTPMYYQLRYCKEWRILQACDTGECIIVESDLLEMVSENAIDEERESFPQYPELCGEYLIWQNCMGALAIKAKNAVHATKEEEVLKALGTVNLSSEQWTRATETYKAGGYYEEENRTLEEGNQED